VTTVIPDPRERPTLSVEEAGRLVGLGRSASYDAARRGEIPTLKFGRRVVVPTAAFCRLLGIDVAPEDATDEGASVVPLRRGGSDAG
jgi:excisionase family DNA binding protein